VDKSLNRPVDQTHIKINHQIKTICCTEIIKDQLIYIPEMLEYQNLTHNLIRLVDNSIKLGYRFESTNTI
jgi:hypothetical protein